MIFFFASAGASSAYLTVSEIFPVEVRAKAIAVFFAIAQSFGAFGPWLYGELIGNGQDHFRLFIGYLIGAGVMLIGGVVEIFLGVDAEQQSLEDIAQPLSATRPSPHLSAVTGAPRSPAARKLALLTPCEVDARSRARSEAPQYCIRHAELLAGTADPEVRL